jgi:hypothetical protein
MTDGDPVKADEGTREKGATGGNRKFLWHAISLFVILAASLLLFYKHFLTRGMLMHVDMTFPTTISRNLALYNHTWWQYGSVQNIWNVQRIFWTYPLLLFSKLFGVATDRYLLMLFTSTFALAGVSMYALAFFSIRRFKLGETATYAPYAGAVFAALIFMYNPFSVSHLWPYFGYPGYAALPLVFLMLVLAVEKPKAWSIVLLAVLISVAGTGPIDVIWYWFMIVAYLIFYLVSKRFSRASLAVAGKVTGPLLGLYLLLNAMWAMPYLGAQVINKPFNPTYINTFSRSMLDTLSESGTVLNNIRFTAGWGLPINPQPSGSLWVFLSFALPVSALVAVLILRRKMVRDRIVLFWSIMFVISVLLATGTSFVLSGAYSWFVLRAPAISSFGWVFRAADRWLIYAALFYALLLGLLVAYLLRNTNVRKNVVAEVIIIAVMISFIPNSLSYARYVYNPTRIPDAYDNVNKTLAEAKGSPRPIWMPFSKDGFRYTWAPEKRIGAFDVYTSNASLNNLQDIYNPNSYYNWFESLYSKTLFSPGEVLNKQIMLEDDVAAKLLIPFAGEYLVYDSSVPGYTLAEQLEADNSLGVVNRQGNLEVLQPDSGTALIRPATKTVVVDSFYDQLALSQKLTAEQLQGIGFDEDAGQGENLVGAIRLSDYMDPYDINGGFELKGPGGAPIGWAVDTNVNPFLRKKMQSQPAVPDLTSGFTDERASVSLSRRHGRSNRRCLKIVNHSTGDLSVYAVAGREVPVTSGEIYGVKTSIKYENASWTHVQVEGYDPRLKEWVKLVSCPTARTGSSDWFDTECSFYMPAGISRIRPVVVAGWAENPVFPATSWFDDISISRLESRFYSRLLSGAGAPGVTFKQLSPEKYEVQVKGADAPFMLVFAEAYDPLWTVRYEDGKTADPVRLYSTITGFPIEREGSYKLAVEYTPQRWFTEGFIISLVTLIMCLIFLLYNWTRRRTGIRSKQRSGK